MLWEKGAAIAIWENKDGMIYEIYVIGMNVKYQSITKRPSIDSNVITLLFKWDWKS
jgi:hypothetical protein